MLDGIDGVVLLVLLALSGAVAYFVPWTRRAIVRKNAEPKDRVRARTSELVASQARITAIVNTAVDALITIDETATIRSVNPATARIFGYAEEELIGQNVSIMMEPEEGRRHDGYVHRYLGTGEPKILGAAREAVARRRDGTIFPIDISVSEATVDHGRLFVGSIRDITARKRVEAELHRTTAIAEEAAMRDPLTGLWNHNRVLDILIEEMSRSERQGIPVSVAMMDLDHFKQVNDTHGHLVGDEVLKEIALRLQNAVRVYDSVGRFGGEEFVVVLPGADRHNALRAAERIRADISRDPIQTAAGPISITASLGVVTRHSELANDATALLVAADGALYEAKEHGRDRVEVAAALT